MSLFRSSSSAFADLVPASRMASFRIGMPAQPAVPDADLPLPDAVPEGPSPLSAPSRPWSLGSLAGRMVEISSDGPSVALSASVSLVLEAQLRREPAAWIAIDGSCFYPPDLAEAGVDLEQLPVVRVGDARVGARAADLLLRSGGFAVVVLDGIASPHAQPARESRTRGKGPGYSPSYSQSSDRQAKDVVLGAPWGSPRSARRYVAEESRGPRSNGGRLHGKADGASAAAASAGAHAGDATSIPPGAQSRLAGLAKKHDAVLVCITSKERGASSLGPLVSLRSTGRIRKTAFDRFTWELEALKDKRGEPGWEHSGVCRGPTGLH